MRVREGPQAPEELTLEEMAKSLGIRYQTLSEWATSSAIARYTGIPQQTIDAGMRRGEIDHVRCTPLGRGLRSQWEVNRAGWLPWAYYRLTRTVPRGAVTPRAMAEALGFDYDELPEYSNASQIGRYLGLSNRQSPSLAMKEGRMEGVQTVVMGGAQTYWRAHKDGWLAWAYYRYRGRHPKSPKAALRVFNRLKGVKAAQGGG